MEPAATLWSKKLVGLVIQKVAGVVSVLRREKDWRVKMPRLSTKRLFTSMPSSRK